jgi:N-acetylglucosaminyl-diphospho-decaprenol L-rhamnosyltransferase
MTSEERGPRLGVVTVAYRSNEVLPSFLHSIADASVEPVATVVVDNCPGEGSQAQAQAESHGAVYMALPSNPGYGGAINAGVAALPPSVEWVIVSNPDVVLSNGAVDTMLATAMSSDEIGAVGPEVRNGDGSVYPSARAIPSLRTGVGHALFVNLWQANPWTRRYRQELEVGTGRRNTGWLSGSCLVVRRSAFEAIGGFDEAYFMYFEDVDLGYRLGQAGYRSVYEPAAAVTHTGAHSTTKESARMVSAHHASARRFLSKKYAGWWLWPVRAALSTGLAVRSALVRRHI